MIEARRGQADEQRINNMTDRMARIRIDAQTWATFRSQLGSTPVNVGLGRLIEREVGRVLRRSANDVEGARIAVADARVVAAELEELIGRLERNVAHVDAPPTAPRLPSDDPINWRTAGPPE